MRSKVVITRGAVWIAFVAVMILAAVSWWASTLHLGPWSIPVALTIAAVKVGVVGLVFMELGEHGGGVRVAAIIAPAFLTLMLLAMLADVWLR